MPVNPDSRRARPFLKWAGGKGQLLTQLETYFPPQLSRGEISRYIEPFVGSGALFFKVYHAFPVREFLLADANPELVLVYKTIQRDVEGLIQCLAEIETNYLNLGNSQRRDYYYEIREKYNQQRGAINFKRYEQAWAMRSAYMIFMNRTGYNGLFRMNSKGEFNVPFGRYKNPRILDARNLRNVAALLQGISIQCCDFENIAPYVDHQTLVYFDPPYRPLSQTAHFTSYSKDTFDDQQQLRLAAFYRQLDAQGGKLMLSNSDPRNLDPGDDFFEKAYQGFRIERLKARRNINSQPGKRGAISELLILNF